jgi:type VI secretion system protein ImpK
VVVVTGGVTRLRTFLAAEIKEGLVEVFEDAQTITVRIANRNMFGSGEATLNSGYGPLLDRIGTALQDEPGKVLVVGHTDNQPIRTARFPSNWQLSTARAETVARMIAAKLSDPSRVKAEGHADNEPIAPNTTPEGRQRNRRTDIVLIKPPAPP